VAIPFWYSIHNVLLQQILPNGLTPVSKGREGHRAERGQPGGAAAGRDGVGAGQQVDRRLYRRRAVQRAGRNLGRRQGAALLRRRLEEPRLLRHLPVRARHQHPPEWAQRVTNAIVKAQLWTRSNQLDTARLLSSGDATATRRTLQVLSKVLTVTDYAEYEKSGVIVHKDWNQRRIDFQPYPFPRTPSRWCAPAAPAWKATPASCTSSTRPLSPSDLVDDRFVRKAIAAVGGPAAFGLPANLLRSETLAI
jgi:NitT/TauT family transport system substrate-binding protein